MATDPQLERMVAAQMGADPKAQVAQATQKATQAAPKPQPSTKPTTAEQASKVGSPQTEGDKQQQEAVMYAVDMGGQKRNLTPQQISGTFERYRDLNHKNAQMAPINKLAEGLMNRPDGKTYTPEQVAKFLDAAAKSMTKNATLGREQRNPQAGVAQGRPPQQPSQPQRNMKDEFAKYEDENAITLPPGYREAGERMARMEQQMAAQNAAMQNMMRTAQAGAQKGVNAAQQAQGDRATAIRQTISNNLNRAQKDAGLADGDAQQFMAYAGERGYTAEDFADAGLTNMVVNDFKNQRNSPEFARLQEMATRRQAYLKSPSPSGGASQSPQANTQSATAQQFGRMSDMAMKNRIG